MVRGGSTPARVSTDIQIGGEQRPHRSTMLVAWESGRGMAILNAPHHVGTRGRRNSAAAGKTARMEIQPLREDALVWAPSSSSKFTVRACYSYWRRENPEVFNMVDQTRWLWKRKMPLKVKIFMWMAFQNHLLTKEYRARWNPTASTQCEICYAASESTDHLFGQCPTLVPLWRMVGHATGIHTSFHNKEELWHLLKGYSRSGVSSAQARVIKLIIPEALWAVWLGRNKLLFAGQRFYVENVWEETMRSLSAWGCMLGWMRGVRLVRGVLQFDPG
ncbi:hypothetical protein QJS10_CPA05g01348 [Acorus calamus]|uniref:Reverse transcriptase zinc-binding domain-containing protein n=1 Tax=Acorus calamus TaxID=4465 RepID=A0AAV9ERZ0_ACOCL|nr:hypothetical protein QJS10_CPA05g01348 [Acorus calamus]